jgi:hypothetical protein
MTGHDLCSGVSAIVTFPAHESSPLSGQDSSALRRWQQRRRWLILGVIVVVATIWRPVTHLLRTLLTDVNERPALPRGQVDDASRLNQTRVAEVIDVSSDMATAEQQLQELFARAA